MVIAFTDVAYQHEVARGACVFSPTWTAQFPQRQFTVLRTPIAPYVPGAFWERELPVLTLLLEGCHPEIIVVDGYVWLDANGRKGLGAHLYDAKGIPVVGVAKTAFEGSAFAERVVRGASGRPLWVTAVGLDPIAAAEAVRSMHGAHRLPTLLHHVDHLARFGLPNG